MTPDFPLFRMMVDASQTRRDAPEDLGRLRPPSGCLYTLLHDDR